jgi:NAD(P)H-dependent flavin oxidoreductase YrpB (nitropropane dioxygenase family)
MQKIIDYCREIKRLRPDIVIMVGNIANPETYHWYAKNKCVDYIRIGIGNGNGCLTTKQSGIGHPMASLISEIRSIKLNLAIETHVLESSLPAIVADGGMKDYSDIIKSLALGADYVMIGSIFNKAFESSAPNYLYGVKLRKKHAKYFFDKGYPVKKYFRGMSTKEAQKAMGKTSFKTSEGVTRIRKVEYHLSGWVENFEHYLRNAMSYANAKTLEDFKGKVEICQISKNAYDRFNK